MLKLYPMPIKIEEREGTYNFEYVSVCGMENEVILNEFSEKEIKLSAIHTPNVKYVKEEGLAEEEYKLAIDQNGAEIRYFYDSGAYYATQTLCQLLNMKNTPYVEINDKPLLKRRVMSLDISRGKIPKTEHFKEIIDYLASARYNILCLYYDRIVIQFPSLEGLWEDDAITLDELRQIKKWCNEKFIKLQVSIETFGHLENFLKHDRFKHLSNSLDETKPGGDLNPYHPEALPFIEMLLDDVMPFCDTEFYEMHGDEVVSLKTGKTKQAVEEKGVVAVYMEHIRKVCDLIVNKYHKIPFISDDMFVKRNMTEAQIEENLKLFPQGAWLDDWGYEQEYAYHKFTINNRIFKKMGIPFLNAASTGLFAQYVPRTYNQTLNAEVSCRSAYENGGLGAIQSIWGDRGNPQYFVMELTGLFTFGATSWNYKSFQLSYVHEYLNKFVFKAEDCDFAGILSSFGDAAWYTKGKCPDTNGFAFASKFSFETTLLWNGFHSHTGIDTIQLYDMVDIYGCEKALKLVANSRSELERAKINCPKGEEMKEKALLNARMFEWAIRICYFKLCVLCTKDYEKAASLAESIKMCYDEITSNYARLWRTENREFGSNLFPGYLKSTQAQFEDKAKNLM